MEKAPSAVIAHNARYFLENILGFGNPVEGSSISNIFAAQPNSYYYGARNSHSQATLNVVTENIWEAMHFNESNPVFLDIFSQPLVRVKEFIEKELAKYGLALGQLIEPNQGSRIQKIIGAVEGFRHQYLDNFDVHAEFKTSFTLRRQESVNNWDLLLRVAMFGREEKMYLEFNFPQIVRSAGYLLTERQISMTKEAVSTYLQCFGKKSKLFRDIPKMELSGVITQHVINCRDATADVVYPIYSKLIEHNKSYIKERIDVLQAEEVMEWSQLDDISRHILTGAVETARTYVNGFIIYNTMEALA